MKENEKKSNLDIIYDSLLKKSNGYYADEIIEEYSYLEDGTEKLLKKKVTKKFVPPDLNATKLLLEYYSGKDLEDVECLSEEETDKKAIKLMKEYLEMSNISKDIFNKETLQN